MGRKKGYSRKSYESARPGRGAHDAYIPLHASMTNSQEWRALTGNQRALYFFCRFQRYDLDRPKPGAAFPLCEEFQRREVFFMNFETVKDEGLYKSRATFYKDMRALVAGDFLVCLYDGKARRQKSIYKCSDAWNQDRTANGDPYTALYKTMLTSKAWKSLNGNQKELYRFCRAQLYAKKKPPNVKPGKPPFFMNWKIGAAAGLYATEKTFYKDLDRLVKTGFLDCLYNGLNDRKKSIYEYSDRWQSVGSENKEGSL